MKSRNLHKNILISSILCFGSLTGLAGAAVYFDPTLMNNWIGPAILGAPPAIGLIFYLIARSWTKETVPSQDVEKAVEPEEKETTITPETAPPPDKSDDFNHQITKSPNHQIPLAPEIAIVQTLGLLQREGRLIDFLQEDIEPYDDAQIGAAVREVHRGCKAALKEVFGLSPVLKAAEGSQVEIEEDFDPTRIKLIGNIQGNPPFKGTLRHCGWKFTEVHLPEWTAKEKTDVLAPAEVEIS
ncbi:MAG: DUF2760 domain-containing protein [Thermodesulfobacteriota bacterium]|nr:DUF2760 domain-containing protein [Deltaproteobacteria bacterium]RKX59462.1 MAG: DUF2760 domain-containing protein [Thermodesulfobacteriota bacterium]